MLLLNQSMLSYIAKMNIDIEKSTLDLNLQKILSEDFLNKDGGVFFQETYPDEYLSGSFSADEIKKIYADLSGMEQSFNKIHIGDYVNDDKLFEQAIVFFQKFIEKWNRQRDSEVLAVLAFQDDDVGLFATFNFHQIRDGEIVYDLSNIEEIIQPVMFYLY